jgi:hypothetical protein
MSELLKILPVKKKPELPSELNPILLPHPFLLSLVAPPRAGKSNCIINLICNSEFYRGKKTEHYFDDIYYCSPTSCFDKTTCNALKLLDNCIQIHELDQLYSLDIFLRQIMKEQAEEEVEERKKVLIVLDDLVGIMQKNPEIALLSTKYRHYGISIIAVSQSFRKLPLLIRNCTTGLIVFGLHNEREVTKVFEEHGCSFPNWYALYNYATRERYNFLYMDIEHQKVYHNFTTCLYDIDNANKNNDNESESESDYESDSDSSKLLKILK